MDSLPILQLPHVQTFAQGAIWTHDTCHKWDQNWQWFQWGCCSDSHGFWLPFIGISFSAADETPTLNLKVKTIRVILNCGSWVYQHSAACVRGTFTKWSGKHCLIGYSFWPLFSLSNLVYIVFHLACSNKESMLNVSYHSSISVIVQRIDVFFFCKLMMTLLKRNTSCLKCFINSSSTLR